MRAFVTGVTGQDGGYLVEQLLAESTEVHGLVRRGDHDAAALLARTPGIEIHTGDLADAGRLSELVARIKPDEIYNLAGISSVAYSWENPVETVQLSAVAPAVLLEAAWTLQQSSGRRITFLQPSSAEIFGQAASSPQDESTPIRPTSPYGAAKAYTHHIANVYRSRGLHVATCILFNHESPRRPLSFVTRKITAAAARIGADGAGTLRLGNLDAGRDWGWAPDYVDAMVRAIRHEVPDDYVIATGEMHTVAEFAEAALRRAGLGDRWREHIEVDDALLRPSDAAVQVGDPSKALTNLGWRPTVPFLEVVGRMVEHDQMLLKA